MSNGAGTGALINRCATRPAPPLRLSCPLTALPRRAHAAGLERL